jgi:hypothetical protein
MVMEIFFPVRVTFGFFPVIRDRPIRHSLDEITLDRFLMGLAEYFMFIKDIREYLLYNVFRRLAVAGVLFRKPDQARLV